MSLFYIVPTPIGNLSDISERALEILSSVDVVLAEDTRRTKILMDRFDINTPLISLHGHNEVSRIDGVIDRLNSGNSLALVSDAGTPLLSDPGAQLVSSVVEAGHKVIPIPGPSAILTALVGTGFPPVPFTFHGFVPKKKKIRNELLESIVGARDTSVVFESPERLCALLEGLQILTEEGRRIVVAREMTKIHEEFFRGTIDEAVSYFTECPPRGEVTVVVSPRVKEETDRRIDVAAARALAQALLDEGLTPSRSASELSIRLRIGKNMAYEVVHSLLDKDESVI